MKTPILNTERFVIREFKREYFDAFVGYRSQPEVAKFQSWTDFAHSDAENVSSYKLLEKLGFRREAQFVQNVFFKGAWGDEYQYALLRSEQKFTDKI